ncbi:uncharacterized protein FA14DRAFT_159597 [Meira miltonrushii]|uniref:Uncharacterized protein n=1 Tax=Meira miltonrushii TaxID=1280837 RepID=A0A316VJH3_9BASI|nr:uncharacterized protein FA14DRAFT_159597 [Meira miltonrushii]PWN37650.1 hypothetical protein FA14DRAFT_159597 [Meira miltonrushii]
MTAITNTHRLYKRDTIAADGTRDIGGGAIAGIIIGIVVVCAILAGLLAWRLYTYRTNRDFFTGKSNLNYGSASMLTPAKAGHIRSTRGIRKLNDDTDSVLEIDGNDHATENVDSGDYNSEKHLITSQREQHQKLTQAVNTNQEEWDQHEQQTKERYPSETNRTSWWVPSFGRAIPREQVEEHNNVQSEVMRP